MNEMEILIRHTCPACKGTGLQANVDYDKNDTFPHEPYDTCMHCSGKKKIETWLPIETALREIAELDIQII